MDKQENNLKDLKPEKFFEYVVMGEVKKAEKLLKENKEYANCKYNGATPLHAVPTLKMAMLLVKHGANIVENQRGKTALDVMKDRINLNQSQELKDSEEVKILELLKDKNNNMPIDDIEKKYFPQEYKGRIMYQKIEKQLPGWRNEIKQHFKTVESTHTTDKVKLITPEETPEYSIKDRAKLFSNPNQKSSTITKLPQKPHKNMER